ncbi:MAG TPA: pyrimidine 5'-nucleotidase, partial [Rhodospirillaceae bacterium]|nr:pyrimidine 5'-nucleotidase [Rhodospirillaceae bacterium]
MLPSLATADHWIFDLDNTLYPPGCNLFYQVDIRMRAFIAEYFDIDEDEAFKLQKRYFRDYGTTLNGLMKNHDMEPDAFLDYVHDIDVSVIDPNPTMERALSKLPGRKLVYTNGSVAHAERIMARLGISHHFDDVFDIVAAEFLPKPDITAYHALVAKHDIEPTCSVMVEDVARNLEPAKALGMATVLIETDHRWSEDADGTDYVDHRVEDLTEWLDELVKSLGEGA